LLSLNNNFWIMKNISLLKKLVAFYFYFGVFGLLFLMVGFPIIFSRKKDNISLDEPLELKFMDMNMDVSNMHLGQFIAIIVIGVAILFPLLNGIFLFKKSLTDLSSGNYFSDLVVSNFKKIGQCFLIFGVGQWVYKLVMKLIVLQDLSLGIDNTLFLSLILGLFFLFLSEAFGKARATKQENDLTI